MAGLITITGISGAGPVYTADVVTSVGVTTGDHVLAPLDGLPVGRGAPYRVTDVPDGTTLELTDDLVPGGGTYGLPGAGDGQYYTPTTHTKLSAPVDDGPFVGAAYRRDNELMDERHFKSGAIADPTGGTTIDAEARTAITSVLVVLRNLGLIEI